MSVGASSGSGSGGSGGSGGSPTSGGGSGGGSPWTCTYTYLALNNEGGFANGGPLPGSWYSVTCVDIATGVQQTQTVWVTSAPPAAAPAVDPRAVALEAERSITLPAPAIRANPSATTVVGLDTWFWIDPSLWRAESVTATAGAVTATAVARPVAVLWSTGDGGRINCAGPGTAYAPDVPASWQTTDCGYTYLHTSAGQPALDGNPDDGAFMLTATVEWSVSWTSTGVPGGGSLPTLYTTGSSPLRRRSGGECEHRVGCDGGHRVGFARVRSMSLPGMTQVRRQPAPEDTPTERRPPSGHRDRRPLVVVGSVALVAASIAGFAGLYASADTRTPAIVVVTALTQGQPITSADLGVAEVSASSGVDFLPVSESSLLVGKRAASAVPTGSLLTMGDVSSAPVVGAGSAVVGLALKDGSYPTAGLSPGDRVMVVQTAGAGVSLAAPSSGSASGITVGPVTSGVDGVTGSSATGGVSATGVPSGGSLGAGVLVASASVFSVEAPGPNSGGGTTLLVSIQVPDEVAAEVSTAAAAAQVSLVLLPLDVTAGSDRGPGSAAGASSAGPSS